MESDVIAAVATPRGTGGIAVIRISGDGACDTAARVFTSSVPAGKMKPRTAYFGKIVSDGVTVDTGVLTNYCAPASYTGEDVAEISCHGGVYVTEKVLSAVLEAGARLAAPGEFTRRAFINGKLLLDEAEAVGEIISADSEKCLEAAAANLTSGVGKALKSDKEKLKELLARFFAVIDWPDEEIGDSDIEDTGKTLRGVAESLEKLIASAGCGRLYRDGLKTVIAGRPNVGKSTLMNRLAGEERSIVNSEAGTTRDVVRESVSVNGIKLILSDTAGIRETENGIEAQGVKRAEDEMKSAELVLFLLDGTSRITDEDIAVFDKIPPAVKKIAVFTKNDLAKLSPKDTAARLAEAGLDMPCAAVCAVTGQGTEKLCELIVSASGENAASGPVILSERQYSCLLRAKKAVSAALALTEAGEPADKTAEELSEAVAAVSELDGTVASEEIINKIFEKFCVGK